MKNLFKTKKINSELGTENQAEKVDDKKQIKAVLDLYNSNFEKPKTQNSRTLVVCLIISIIFGFIAGMLSLFLFLSGAFSNSKMFSWLDINSLLPSENIIIQKQEQTTVLADERFLEVSQEVSPVVVGIFKYKLENEKDFTKNFYSEKEFLGNGLIMTSDGWIATTNDIAVVGEQYSIVTQNNKIYKVVEIKQDSNLGIIFLKVDADNFSVVSFLKFSEIELGQENILFKGIKYFNKKLISTRISDKNFKLTSKITRDSEKRYLFLTLDKEFDKTFFGAVIFNFNKQAVGLLSNYNNQNYIVPADYFKKSFNQLITLGEIKSTYLGIDYINLATSISSEFGVSGAIITNIKFDSPLKNTEIKVKDTIIKINDDAINGNKNFTNLIQNYRAGDKIKLTILNNNQEEKVVEVELK